MSRALVVASYNILADAYVRRGRYPHTPKELLDPPRRHRALAAHVGRISADVWCLQETEPASLAAIRAALPDHAAHALRKPGKPDAVATLTRAPVEHVAPLVFPDGSGHVALLLAVRHDGRLLGIANTHVKWDPPGKAVGVAQADALLDAARAFVPACDGFILCGDFNAKPDSELAKRIRARGFLDAYEGTLAPTSNANGEPKRIDFLFYTRTLTATATPLRPIVEGDALPSAEEPSDHLVIRAAFDWR